MPLRMRLSLLFALATAVAVAIAGLAFVAQLRVSVDASLDPGLRDQLTDVTDDLTASEPEPAVPGSFVQVLAPDGRVLSSSGGTAALLTDMQRRQALGGETSFTTHSDTGGIRVLAAPATRDGGPVVVAVGTRTVVSDVAVERAELALLLGAPAAVLLAGVGAWMLAGAALRPVERMRREAANISDSDLDRRLGVPATRDEIAALGTTINALLARLQEALHRERGFVADAGHELRTPLAILRAELELAARPGRTREALVEAINEAGAETDRLIRLTEDLLLLARVDNHQPFLRPQRLSVPDLLYAAARGAGTRAAEREVTVAVQAPAALDVEADPDRLRQAVDNLLDNAARHSPRGGVVELRADLAHPGVLSIEVGDRGSGFPVDFLPHAFDRFRRAGDARSRDEGGTGLGLSIVRAIARAHGGEAVATNRPGGGAAVRISLPDRAATDRSYGGRRHPATRRDGSSRLARRSRGEHRPAEEQKRRAEPREECAGQQAADDVGG
jgi:two-component system, OmpR family, sensor kinase